MFDDFVPVELTGGGRSSPFYPKAVPKGLETMMLLQRGSRLSVQPVTAEEFAIVCKLAGATARRSQSGTNSS